MAYCSLDKDYVYFHNTTPSEVKWLHDSLTWEFERTEGEGDDKKKIIETKTLLNFFDGKTPSTSRNLYWLLQSKAPFKMDILEDKAAPDYSCNYDVTKNLLANIELMDFQVMAVTKALRMKEGICDIKTGGGKTEIILAICRCLLTDLPKGKHIVIVVPSTGLAEQTIERASRRGFDHTEISALHSGTSYNGAPIQVVVVNTLYNAVKNKDHRYRFLYEDTVALFFDEGHHGKADSWVAVKNEMKSLQYFLVFSGSPFGVLDPWGDFDAMTLISNAGRIIVSVSYNTLRSAGLIATPYVHYHEMSGRTLSYYGNFMKIYQNNIVKNEKRNQWIYYYAKLFAVRKMPVLIIVKELDHAKRLMMKMEDMRVICVFGGSTGLIRSDYGDIIEVPIDYNAYRNDFENGHYDVAIMSPVGDEGFDMPAVMCVIIAAGGKSLIKLLQRIGRGLRRKKKGPNRSYIIDFMDTAHVFLRSQSRGRRSVVEEEIQAEMIDDRVKFIQIVDNHYLHLSKLEQEASL